MQNALALETLEHASSFNKMKITCLKHVSFEGPASIADWANQHGHTIETVEVYLNETLPTVDSFDMLLVMGGPMNIYQYEEHPWLVAEKALIGAAIQAGKRVVGICLGGQLIADVMGAPVTRGKQVEIGWFDIQRGLECPPNVVLPESLRVYHWHGDTFAIPKGAQRIASNATCENQGFVYENRVLAWQCHLETTPESLNALIENCADELTDGPTVMDAETMQSEPPETYATMQKVLFRLLNQLG